MCNRLLMAAEWEHVEQITGNTNEVEVWSLFDQPSKPMNAEMKVGGDKKLHGFGKCSSKVVEMSSIEPYSQISDAV